MRNKIAGYLVAGAAIALGGWSFFVTAPEIEAKLTEAAATEIPASIHNTGITVSGRDITITGLAQDGAEREALLGAADAIYGRRVVTDGLTVLDIVSPYIFEAAKTETGTALSGFVPREAMRGEIEEIFGGSALGLTLAAGAPEGDWLAALRIGQSALSILETGSLNVIDKEVAITGQAGDPYVVEDIRVLLESLPEGFNPAAELSVPQTSPYLFEAFKIGDAKNFRLNSPIRETEARITDALLPDWTGDITPAFGAPDENWADAVLAVASAVALTDNAQARIQDFSVFLEADAPTLEVQDEIEAALATLPEEYTLQQVSISVPPAIPYLFIGRKSPEGIVYEGYIPSAILRAEFATFIGDEAADRLERRAGMPDGFWPDFVKEGVAALGALEAGTLRIEGRTMQVTGVAANPVMASAIENALDDLPAGYGAQFDLALEDDGQPSFLALAFETGQPVSLTGKAPEGFTVERAAAALRVEEIIGEPRASVLSGEAFYLERLQALSSQLRNYKLLNITFSETETKISGVAQPRRDVAALTDDLIAIFGEEAEIELQETPLDVVEGTVRTNELTGLLEVFRNRQWQPFASEAELISSCETRIGALLQDTTILFETGSSVIDPASETVLDDLTAILGPCMENSAASVELGGHTDNQGDPGTNLALSEARAAAVREELLSRGIEATRITAKGLGDTQPVASNDTAEGRAANRRTTFTWITE